MFNQCTVYHVTSKKCKCFEIKINQVTSEPAACRGEQAPGPETHFTVLSLSQHCLTVDLPWGAASAHSGMRMSCVTFYCGTESPSSILVRIWWVKMLPIKHNLYWQKVLKILVKFKFKNKQKKNAGEGSRGMKRKVIPLKGKWMCPNKDWIKWHISIIPSC